MGHIAVAHMTLSGYSRKRASQDVEEGMHLGNDSWRVCCGFSEGGVFSAGCAALPRISGL